MIYTLPLLPAYMNIIPGELRDSFLQTASSCIFSVYISQRFCPPLLLWVTPPPDEQQNQNLYLSRRPQAVGFLGSRVGNSGFMKLSRLESPPNTQPFARGSPLPASDGQVLVRTPVDRPCFSHTIRALGANARARAGTSSVAGLRGEWRGCMARLHGVAWGVARLHGESD